MSKPVMKGYPAEFKERAVKLAVESEQPIAQTARGLGINENTLHTWIGKYHRVERQEKEVNDAHLYEELKLLRKENALLFVVNRIVVEDRQVIIEHVVPTGPVRLQTEQLGQKPPRSCPA